MNSYQRVNGALAFQEVDRVPVVPFVMGFVAKFAGIPYSKYCTDYRKVVEAQLACVERFKYDIVTVDTDAYREAEACGALIEFPYDDLPVEKRKAIQEKKDLLKINISEIFNAPRLVDKVEGVREFKKKVSGQIPILGWVEGPYQSASILRGLTEFMIDTKDDENFIKDLLELTTQIAIDYGTAQAEAGADIVGIGDAVASLISSKDYETYVLPYTKKVVKAIQQKGAKVKYHICGDASHLLEQLKKLEADLINVDNKVDLKEARNILHDVCIKGNLNPTKTLLYGTTDVIQNEAKKCIEIGGLGYMLSPGCEVPKDTPHENFEAFVAAAK